MNYVQLNITGVARDRRTRARYCWCITVDARKAARKATSLRRSKHISRVDIVEREGGA